MNLRDRIVTAQPARAGRIDVAPARGVRPPQGAGAWPAGPGVDDTDLPAIDADDHRPRPFS